MKKRGSALIECLIAITILMIGIMPITKFTLNSLRLNKRSGEIEEAARITTTIIDRIKSENYKDIVKQEPWGTNIYVIANDGSVNLKNPDDEKSSAIKSITENDAIFILQSRGIDMNGAELRIDMIETNLKLKTGENYTNPVTGHTDGVIFGDNGFIKEKPVYGRVTLSYKSKKSNSKETREYGQNFVLMPMENWK